MVVMIGICPLIAYNAIAQFESQDRLFVKVDLFTELEDIKYLDNSEISYDRIGHVQEQIIIHRWNEITAVNQVLITARMTALGYEDRGLVQEQTGVPR